MILMILEREGLPAEAGGWQGWLDVDLLHHPSSDGTGGSRTRLRLFAVGGFTSASTPELRDTPITLLVSATPTFKMAWAQLKM